jgi:site-specific recombinase XerD
METSINERVLLLKTQLNYEGYSIETVSKMSGHSSISTTETFYEKVNLTRISKELLKLGY